MLLKKVKEEGMRGGKITTSLIPIRKERPWRRCSAIRETINLKKATD